METAIELSRNTLAKTQTSYKGDFDKCLRISRDWPTVGGWVFLDKSDAVGKPSGDGKIYLIHVAEGPYKILEVSARTAVIQRVLLVERVTIYRVTPIPSPLHPPEEHKYAATPEELAKKNTSGDGWLVDGVLKHRLKHDQSLEFFVQWSGDHQPWWEPRTNITEELIRDNLLVYKIPTPTKHRLLAFGANRHSPWTNPKPPHPNHVPSFVVLLAFLCNDTRNCTSMLVLVIKSSWVGCFLQAPRRAVSHTPGPRFQSSLHIP